MPKTVYSFGIKLITHKANSLMSHEFIEAEGFEDEQDFFVVTDPAQLVWDGEQLVYLLIHANWCGHCAHYKPLFDKAATENKDDRRVFYSLESQVWKSDDFRKKPFQLYADNLRDWLFIGDGEQKIKGYPTILEKLPKKNEWTEVVDRIKILQPVPEYVAFVEDNEQMLCILADKHERCEINVKALIVTGNNVLSENTQKRINYPIWLRHDGYSTLIFEGIFETCANDNVVLVVMGTSRLINDMLSVQDCKLHEKMFKKVISMCLCLPTKFSKQQEAFLPTGTGDDDAFWYFVQKMIGKNKTTIIAFDENFVDDKQQGQLLALAAVLPNTSKQMETIGIPYSSKNIKHWHHREGNEENHEERQKQRNEILKKMSDLNI